MSPVAGWHTSKAPWKPRVPRSAWEETQAEDDDINEEWLANVGLELLGECSIGSKQERLQVLEALWATNWRTHSRGQARAP